ncbi:hypothetical protein NM208_g8927 [Fusarium decemcellulare]|uniref:Uncharacterized protein n=1 Tax=Fusarium decemcellulare TaxID=57161 RepID=A0ACC1S3G1_9HYPO|nr:hypothetical protein NM208_g8927 [Fusarium decemcellulare]
MTNKQRLLPQLLRRAQLLRNKAPADDVNDATMRTFAGEECVPHNSMGSFFDRDRVPEKVRGTTTGLAARYVTTTNEAERSEDQHKLAEIKRVWDRFSHTWDEDTKGTIVDHLADIVTWPANETQPSGHKLWKVRFNFGIWIIFRCLYPMDKLGKMKTKLLEQYPGIDPLSFNGLTVSDDADNDDLSSWNPSDIDDVEELSPTGNAVSYGYQGTPVGSTDLAERTQALESRMSYNGVLRYRKAQKCVEATPYIKKHDEAITQPAASTQN